MVRKLAIVATIGVSLLMFFSLIIYVIWFNLTNARYVQLSRQDKENGSLAGILVPSQILGNRAKYNKQRIAVRGRVDAELVICERKECPAGDSCCGCPPTRNLKLVDAETSSISSGQKILEILDAEGQPFCRRPTSSCDYDCRDWILGGVYDVEGTFLTDTLQVEDKTLVKRANFLDSLKNAFLGLQKTIKKFKTSGSYILQ